MDNEQKDTRIFTKRHLWADCDPNSRVAYIGITDFLVEKLSEIRSIDMPEPADEIDADTIFVHLYLVNRVHHLRAPLTGRILEINQEVLDNPSLLHLDPNKYWLLTMEYDSDEEVDLQMDKQRYDDYVNKL